MGNQSIPTEPANLFGRHKMRLINKGMFIITLLSTANSLFAETGDFVGASSSCPAKKWEQGMLTGNGSMGAVVLGEPYNDTVIITHHKCYLPLGTREIVENLAPRMPELKKAALEAGVDGPKVFHHRINDLTNSHNKKATLTDPFHPAYFLRIKMQENTASNYRLIQNFENGEIVTTWSDSDGDWERKLFISRADNVAVMSIKGPEGKVSCDLQVDITHKLVKTSIESRKGFITAHTVYREGKGGYDSVIRITVDKGTVKHTATGASISNADEIVLLMRVRDWRTPSPKNISEAWVYSPENPYFKAKDYKTNHIADITKELSALPTNYNTLLKPHAEVHGELFSRVKLDLGGKNDDRKKTSERLINEAIANNDVSLALMERMYDACRYLMICASGERPPNLQGLWTGTWAPAWSGDYTLDSNLELCIQSTMSCNMPELMEGYFTLIESWLPDARLNAKKFYGCRGVVSNVRASSVALQLHWGKFPGEMITGCLGWLAHFFYDYYQFTGNKEFLKNRAVPLLKEIALFYEDLLEGTEDENGKFRFFISKSPEHRELANATFDISIAKAVYRYLIRSCKELSIEQDNIQRWKEILAKMPPYLINQQGQLQEWAWKGTTENFNHRHHSAFLPLYQFYEFDPQKTPELWKASQLAFDGKVKQWFRTNESRSNAGHITHGMANQGQCAARLGRSDIVYEMLTRLITREYTYPSFIMSYKPRHVTKAFGFDPIGAIPDVINNSLVSMWDKTLDILPALPKEWPEGSIEGILLRNQVKLNRFAWKESGKHIEMCLTSQIKQDITLRLPSGKQIESIEVIEGTGKTHSIPQREDCCELSLPARETVSLRIGIR